MTGIIADISSDIQKLRKIKAEIAGVKKELKGIDIRVNLDIKENIEARLKSLMGQYDALVAKIAKSEGKIMLSLKKINDASGEIIKAQKKLSNITGSPQSFSTIPQGKVINTEETASVQAQVRAYNDLKAEISSILGTREANIKRLLDEQNAIKVVNAEIKRLTKYQENHVNLSSSQQQRLEQLNDSLLTHKTALAEVQQVLSNNAKLDNATATSMNELSQSLSRMKLTYRELTEEERNSSFGKELLSSINQADTKIKELDATIGNHARNVGNYASGWNGLGMSVQQVVRELPAAKMGLNMFFLAISNNIPILVDEINRAKVANERLKASGQSSTPVWKQVTSSLFSWQSAMMVGITLLTMYEKDIFNWVGSLFNANEASKETKRFQDALNQSMRDANKDIIDETTKLNILYRAATDAKKSVKERAFAVRELKKEFPSYFGLMDDEKIKAGKAADAYKLLTDSIIASVKARRTEKLIVSEQNKYLDYLGETTIAYQKMQKAQDKLKQSESIYNKIKTKENKEIYEIDKRTLERRKEEYDKARAKSQKQAENVYNLTTTINASKLYGNQKDRDKAIVENKDFWTTQKNNAETALDSIASTQKKLMDDGKFEGIPQDVINQYKDAIKLKKEAEKQLKVYDFSTNQENIAETLRQQQEKYNLLLDKQSRDRIRKEEDLQMQTEQARINAMKEGNARALEQMNLDHKKEMKQLKRQRADDLRALIEGKRAEFEANPKNKGKVFNASGIKLPESQSSEYDQQEKFLLQKQANDRQAYMEAQKRSWNEYLSEYANFQERKQALLRLYDDKIAKATTAGKKASLKEEFKNKLKDMNLEEIKSSINFADIFSNLDSQSTEAIRILRDKLKEIIEKSAEDLKPTDLKSLQEALQNMDLKVSERDPFSELKNGVGNYKAACKEVEDAQKNYNATLEKGWTIVAKYDGETGKTTYKYLDQKKALEGLTDAEREKRTSQIQLTQSVNSIGEQGQHVVQAGNDLVDMLTSLGVSVPESVAGTLNGLGQVMSSLASIDLMNPMSILTGITGTLAGLGKTIGSIFGLGKDDEYTQYIKMQEHLKRVSEVWDDLIDKKKEYIGTSVGSDAADAEKEAISIIEKRQQQNKEAANKRLEVSEKGKHTYGKRMWSGHADYGYNGQTWEGVSSEIKEQKGIDIGYKLSNMANLTAEQLDWIKENYKDLWANLDEEYKAYLENIIDGEKEKKEVIKAGNEAILSVSLESFSDGILNSLYDIKSTANDISDDISDYMRKALIKAMYVKNYQSEMEGWYEKWKDYMSDDKLDDNERNDLDSTKKDLIDKMTKDVQGINEMFDSSSSQSSTSGGFQSMSQDTGEELNGRFTALQIAGEEIKNQAIEQTSLLSSINEKMSLLDLTNEDIPQLTADVPDIAGQARESTASAYQSQVIINFPTDQIESLAADVFSLKTTIDEIRTIQVDKFTDIADGVMKMTKNSPVVNIKLDNINDNIKKAL